MFTLFARWEVGVQWRYTNMAAPYWALQICAKYFDKYLRLGKTHKPKTWKKYLPYLSPITSQFLEFIH